MRKLQEQLKEYFLNTSLMKRHKKDPNWRFSSFEELLLEYGRFMEPVDSSGI